MNRCPNCRAHVLIYDWDANLACYLGPDKVDPTPLTVDLAVACRITGRGLFSHTSDRVGRRHISRVWSRHPLPAGHVLLPAHVCGARVPSLLPSLSDRRPIPELCPF
jgi:hypothetical protein